VLLHPNFHHRLHNSLSLVSLLSQINNNNNNNNNNILPPWLRSLDLFLHRRVAIVSWGVHDLFLNNNNNNNNNTFNCECAAAQWQWL
jgi:hypothetical protein